MKEIMEIIVVKNPNVETQTGKPITKPKKEESPLEIEKTMRKVREKYEKSKRKVREK